MRSKIWAVVGSLVLGGLVFATPRAYAKCDVTGVDMGTVAAARAAVDLACPCDSFTNHGQYVKCATGAAKTALQSTNPSCKGAVVTCAARSTCGKTGFVTCCRTSVNGQTKCSTKSSGAHCTAPKGGSACFSVHTPSCCDACLPGGGCASSPSGAFLDAR
jgi:hypothetical protein